MTSSYFKHRRQHFRGKRVPNRTTALHLDLASGAGPYTTPDIHSHTFTLAHQADIQSAQTKFGVGALHGGACVSEATADFAIDRNSIRFWVRFGNYSDYPTSTRVPIIQFNSDLSIYVENFFGSFLFLGMESGALGNFLGNGIGTHLVPGVWYYVVVDISGNNPDRTVALYVDGAFVASNTVNYLSLITGITDISLCVDTYSYIDDFEFYVADYGNVPVPTKPFPDYA